MTRMTTKQSITKRSEDYSKWYLDVVREADLAENSAVRGCMVIKPNGYALWERLQSVLDGMIKETGHVNAYFPLFIPKSFLGKEASHIKGFAKECAVVTHHRLIDNPEGDGVIVDPKAKLDEEVIVRPTSETIIYDSYSRWIKSWRDLPLLINQWANIVRWEMRTRVFLRTTEFLWQEGHTAHATEAEAEEETRKMLDVYRQLAENYLAIPVVMGRKPEHDKFPGALRTYAIEAMMQDGKALQSGTSHNLGQNFAKVFDVKFTDKDGKQKFAWQTSWGVSTRLLGGLIMAHSDDAGLVLPPKMAPLQVVIIPIWKGDKEKSAVMKTAEKLSTDLSGGENCVTTMIDDRDYETPGAKFNEWEKRGVPLRIEIGPRDVEKGSVVVAERDTGKKTDVKNKDIILFVAKTLEAMQNRMFDKAKTFMDEHTVRVDDYTEFKKKIEDGCFIWAHWDGTAETAEKVQEETKATIRAVPVEKLTRNAPKKEAGKCIFSGGKSEQRVLWAKAY